MQITELLIINTQESSFKGLGHINDDDFVGQSRKLFFGSFYSFQRLQRVSWRTKRFFREPQQRFNSEISVLKSVELHPNSRLETTIAQFRLYFLQSFDRVISGHLGLKFPCVNHLVRVTSSDELKPFNQRQFNWLDACESVNIHQLGLKN